MKEGKRILIIGAGLSGLVMGHLFQKGGCYVEIREKNKEMGGLLNDKYDDEAECYISWCGPHIFHFSDARGTREAFNFLSNFTQWKKYDHRVICLGNDSSFTYWPINKSYRELFDYLTPHKDMFNEFIESYSKKMWKDNTEEVIEKIKERFEPKHSRNNLFFEGQETYIPEEGFLNLLRKMSEGIRIVTSKEENLDSIQQEIDLWDKVIVTSHLDSFFSYRLGKIKYEGMNFNFLDIISENKLLPEAVVNLSTHPRYTRISEMNQFYNSNSKKRILCLEEPSRKNRFYPVQTKENLKRIDKYLEYSKKFPKLVFLGRQAEGKYLDIDTAVQNALNKFREMNHEGL